MQLKTFAIQNFCNSKRLQLQTFATQNLCNSKCLQLKQIRYIWEGISTDICFNLVSPAWGSRGHAICQEVVLGRLEAVLRSVLGRFEAVLGRFLGILVPTWGVLGWSWGVLKISLHWRVRGCKSLQEHTRFASFGTHPWIERIERIPRIPVSEAANQTLPNTRGSLRMT